MDDPKLADYQASFMTGPSSDDTHQVVMSLLNTTRPQDLSGPPSHFRSPNAAIILASLAFLVLLVYQISKGSKKQLPGTLTAPTLGAKSSSWLSKLQAQIRWIDQGVSMIYEVYRQHPQTIFQIPTAENFFLLPPSYIDELKVLPESTLNATHALVDYFLGSYTTIDLPIFGRPLWSSVRSLTAQLPRWADKMSVRSLVALEREFPAIKASWTTVTPYPHILQIIALMNAQIFVGDALCDNKQWIEISIDYSRSVFMAAGYLKLVPWFVRPVVAWFVPYMHRIRSHHRRAREILIPEIKRRRELEKKNPADVSSQEMADVMHILEHVSPDEEKTPEKLVDRQLGLAFASTHGTTNHIVNVIYDLATRWNEYGPELRKEVEDALSENNGKLNKSTLNKLWKLDSFMKESQRLEPGSALSFFRKLMKPYTLTTGEILPQSSYVAVAAGPLAQSDPYYPSAPTAFDGLRFYRARLQAESTDPDAIASKKAQMFTTPSVAHMMFGYGKYACPGRFYADVQSKIVLAQLLLRYDFGLVEGATERPRSVWFLDSNIPSQVQEVRFRIRED